MTAGASTAGPRRAGLTGGGWIAHAPVTMRLPRGVLTVLALVCAVAGVLNFVWGAPDASATGEAGTLRFFALHALAMVGNGYLLFAWVFPWFVGRPNADSAARVSAVQASGPATCVHRGAGEIGRLRMSGPLLGVAVHPGGIVVSPFWMPDRAILASEIDAVTPGRALWNRVVRVRHTAPDLTSPLTLYVTEDAPVAQALRRLAPPAT